MRTLYFDCSCGAAGDMLVAALLDAGADFEVVRTAIDSLKLPDCRIGIETVTTHGITAKRFVVEAAETNTHRHLPHILDILNEAMIPETVKLASEQTFRRIAECEAKVHGVPVEKVHFHEVGAVDSIVDVIAAHVALHTLNVDSIMASPLCVGNGTVETAHGLLPVPAPATALLLQGAPIYAGDIQKEMLTPTGAALLTQWAGTFGALPAITIECTGYGAGTRELPDRPNVVRAMVGQSHETIRSHTVEVLETNVDDMTPELLAALISDLLAAGAHDAFVTPVVGKKGGRPGHLVTALCDKAHKGAILEALFAGATTFGVRMRTEERVCLSREWRHVNTPWGVVKVKVGHYDEKERVAPEYDDCLRVATESNTKTLSVYQAALAAAVKGEWLDE